MASLSSAKRVVVKIGSALLVNSATGRLRDDWLTGLAQDVAWLRGQGTEVVLVSSGSIALGRGVLGLGLGTLALEQAQAAAAVGQIGLAAAYDKALGAHGITVAQVLVTLEDSANRRRYINSRNTLETLLSLGAIPIVNENDTIATDEIRYGDNDRLAAQVAVTVGADRLVLLSDVDGLYTANPNIDPAARRFDVVERITPDIEDMAGDAGSGLSKGGMKTKLMAAKTATSAGCAMAITLGSRANPLKALDAGAPSTWFTAEGDPQTARKGWIVAMKPRGRVWLDAGAVRALEHGRSLLPAGVTRVEGGFGRGDAVELLDPEGHVLGQGLTRYTAEEATQLAGHQSHEIEALLGYPGRAALVHRDDMTLTLHVGD
ncbi:glutamate 5-kinase [Pseudooceanicola sp. CBS1P-1]|uniref:Glutamate 5-kinase n=1 Tax=Pseudooceanicola albus TaxID=2692189 RepID=A0A6L7FXA5_9RHOB|nr:MULTISPECIES: glutamate 5-kinase [Pseudooceanicola]MBT9383272.1 glutamate 5-kinase [Pseudooceanicola endophyticus]MXN16405.1 glutamate 5-kinase [Pseudooceanicola albus]